MRFLVMALTIILGIAFTPVGAADSTHCNSTHVSTVLFVEECHRTDEICYLVKVNTTGDQVKDCMQLRT